MQDQLPRPIGTRLTRARIIAALTQPTLGLLLGIVVIAAAIAQVAGSQGYVQPLAWLWMLLWGALCAGILVISALDDPEEDHRVLVALFNVELGIENIRDPEIANMLKVAADYRLEIARFETTATAAAGGLLSDTISSITIWLAGMARLARHVDGFRADSGRQAAAIFDLRQRIDGLEARAGESIDSLLATQLRETIAGRRHQLRMAEELASLNERATLRLEQAVAALGTASYQVAMVARKEVELSGLASLKDGIGAEIENIDQLLSAFDRAQRLQSVGGQVNP